MDYREIYAKASKQQAIYDRNMEIVANFEKQWSENDYVLLDDLLCALANGNQHKKSVYIAILLVSIKNKSLTVWHGDKSHTLNSLIAVQDYDFIPKNTLILKQDFIHWWQQEKSVPFSQRLIDLATIATTKTSKPAPSLVPKKIFEALNNFLEEIEKRAVQNGVSFDRLKMFGIKSQLHDLAKLHCGCLFEKSPHTFYDYLKNSGLCKFNNGNRWSPLYYQLFPEYPKLENRKTRVKTK